MKCGPREEDGKRERAEGEGGGERGDKGREKERIRRSDVAKPKGMEMGGRKRGKPYDVPVVSLNAASYNATT